MLFFSTIIISSSGAFYIYTRQLDIENDSNNRQEQLLNFIIQPLSLALWNLNLPQIDELVAPLQHNSTYCGLRVLDANNSVLRELNAPSTSAKTIHHIPILFSNPHIKATKPERIGTLELCRDTNLLRADLRREAFLQSVVHVIIVLIIVGGCLISMTLLAAPLLDIGEVMRQQSAGLRPITNPELLKNNEIGILGQTFNTMVQALSTNQAALILAKQRAENANIAKTDFLSNISHELRTPMHAILNYTDMGLRHLHNDSPEKLQKYFTNIQTAGERLLILINDLLDLSKLETQKVILDMQPLYPMDIVQNAITEMEGLLRSKNLDCSSLHLNIPLPHEDFPPTLAPTTRTTFERKHCTPLMSNEHKDTIKINADRARLVQVLVNILGNAVRHSPEQATITLSATKDNEWWQLSISNTGNTIPENELESIFDKFSQSSKTKSGAGGTGLGLAICREIIHAHHGIIWAENNPDGNGVTFYIALPIATTTPTSQIVPDAS
jgi:signal transduction histidine kinase